MFVQVLGSMLDDPAAVPGSSKEAEEEGDSYEELVMKRVAAYVQQSQVRGTNTYTINIYFMFLFRRFWYT